MFFQNKSRSSKTTFFIWYYSILFTKTLLFCFETLSLKSLLSIFTSVVFLTLSNNIFYLLRNVKHSYVINCFRWRLLNHKSHLHVPPTCHSSTTNCYIQSHHHQHTSELDHSQSSTDASACGAPPPDQVHGIAAPSFQWRHTQPPQSSSTPSSPRWSTGLYTTYGPLWLRCTGWGWAHP